MLLDLNKLPRRFPEYLLESNHTLVHQMHLVRLVKLQDTFSQSSRDILQFQRYRRQTLYRFPARLFVRVISILVDLIQHISQVILPGELSQYLQLDFSKIRWFVSSEVEVFEIVFEAGFTFHVDDDIEDVLEDDVGGLEGAVVVGGSHQGEQGRFDSLDNLGEEVLLGQSVLQEDLDSSQHQRRAPVLQPVLQNIQNINQLLLILRIVLIHILQYRRLPPLIILLQPIQQIHRQLRRHGQPTLRDLNLINRHQRIERHNRIRILNQRRQLVNNLIITQHSFIIKIKQFQTPKHSYLLHIRLVVNKSFSQQGEDIINIVYSFEVAQITESHASDFRFAVFAVLFESVDDHDGEVGVFLGVGGQVEVDHFLLDLVVGVGCPAHLGEDGGGIETQGHVPDNFFHDLSAFFVVRLVDDFVEHVLDFVYLTLLLLLEVTLLAVLPDLFVVLHWICVWC